MKTQIPETLKPAVEQLRSAANKYLAFKHEDAEANKFCDECVNNDPSSVFRSLVERDGLVLRLVGDEVKPGPAFRGSQLSAEQAVADDEDQEAPQAGDMPFPEGISHRVQNLYTLNLDMHGELDGWLNTAVAEGEA